MEASTSPETVARLACSLRRWEVIGCVLGVILVLAGIGLAIAPAFSSGTARVEGTVTKLEPEVELVGHGSAQAGDFVWYEEVMVAYPVVEYQVGDGTYTYRPRSAFRSYRVGEKVPILYKVQRPGVAKIDTFTERWLSPLLLGSVQVVLGAFILLGLGVSRQAFRRLEATLASANSTVAAAEGPGAK